MRGLFHTERAVKSPETAQIPLAHYAGLSILKTLNWAEVPPFRFDTLVICFGIGVALYFALPVDIFGWALGIIMTLAGAGLWLTRQTPRKSWVWAAFIFAILLGAGRAGWHTAATETPRLPGYERAYELSGWVEEVAASGKGVRWIINVEDFNWADNIDAPEKYASDWDKNTIKPPLPGIMSAYGPSCPRRRGRSCRAVTALASGHILNGWAVSALPFRRQKSDRRREIRHGGEALRLFATGSPIISTHPRHQRQPDCKPRC